MKRLTILYDASCPLCVRCRDWLATQAAFVELELLASGSLEAIRRFGEVPWLGEELVVVSDEGEVWAGAAAFLVALWALEDYREWSYRLSGESLSKVAERFFVGLSHKRRWLGTWFGHTRCTSDRCTRSPSRVLRIPVYR
jgi:predicted DCC family thiol-disulfide oxidoreductase YuxK